MNTAVIQPQPQFIVPTYTKKNPAYGNVIISQMPNQKVQILPPSASRAMHSVTSKNQKNQAVAYIYDYYNYPTTGDTLFNFFGRSSNATGLNNTDTNMQQPGNLGAGIRFLVKQIWVDFLPGAAPISTGAEAAVVATNQALDYWRVMAGKAFLQFTVNQTPQLGYGMSPLKYAASPVTVEASGGVATGGTGAIQAVAGRTINGGYNTSFAPFWLDETMSFAAQITFPAAIPVSTASRIGLVLFGEQTRPAS